MDSSDPNCGKTRRSSGTVRTVKGLLLQPMDAYTGRLGRFAAGVARLLGGVLSVMAGMLVGGGLGYILGVARGNRVVEQMLGGITIGAIVGVLRATGYRYTLGLGVGALLGWILGFSWDACLFAPVAAILGGCIGPVLQRKLHGAPPEVANRALSLRAIGLRILGVMVGIIAGGFVGAVVGFWLCMVLAFGAFLPSQLPRKIDQGALALQFFGFVGGVIGAVTGARCLYVWTVRREAVRPESGGVIGEYEAWKQQHAQPIEEDKQDS